MGMWKFFHRKNIWGTEAEYKLIRLSIDTHLGFVKYHTFCAVSKFFTAKIILLEKKRKWKLSFLMDLFSSRINSILRIWKVHGVVIVFQKKCTKRWKTNDKQLHICLKKQWMHTTRRSREFILQTFVFFFFFYFTTNCEKYSNSL